MAKADSMNLLEFQRKFGTEENCERYLFEKRWPDGFKCPKCGHSEYYYIGTGHPLYSKIKVIEAVSQEEIKRVAEECIRKGSTISTDGLGSYKQLKKNYIHKYQNYYESNNKEFLKWLHVIIGNAKTYIMGTYHGFDDKFLQVYLDEFCYRFNRRFKPKQLFGRLLNACAFGTHYVVPEPGH